MSKEYDAFVENLRQLLLERLGLKEEQIFFKEPEEAQERAFKSGIPGNRGHCPGIVHAGRRGERMHHQHENTP